MKKYKYIILASILLLTACQSKEPVPVELPASQDSQAEQNAEELWNNRIKRVEEIIATEQRYNPLPIAKVPKVTFHMKGFQSSLILIQCLLLR